MRAAIVITGASNVSNAMGYGKKAARKIDEKLMGAKRFAQLFAGSNTSTAAPGNPEREPAAHAAELAAAVRVRSDEEVVLGLSPAEAPRGGVPLLAVRRRKGESMPAENQFRFESKASWFRRVEDKTILEAAREAGRRIPSLCHMDGLQRRGRLPALHGGGGRQRAACAGLHHAGAGRHDGGDQFAAAGAATGA